MKLRQLIHGIATFVPGVNRLRAKGTGGTDSARYCYSVWLRHLVMTKKNGINPYPKIIAELGPGDSLGTGLAALISGGEKYFAFDVVEHANVERNLKIFDELVTLFKNRTPIPGEDEFPDVMPYLKKYDFPADILDNNRMKQALENARLEKIRNSIRDFQKKDSLIQYKVPWYEATVLEKESVDMIYSQAVLEHVEDLRNTYRSMYLWLKPNGHMSHLIDFKSHQLADEWNGHWVYSDLLWKLVKGRRPYLINREPHSTHISIINEEGFKIICDKIIELDSNLTRNQLASKFKSMPDEDLVTSATFIQGVKKTKPST